MLEARRDILESYGLEKRELQVMIYDDVMEQAFEVSSQAFATAAPERKESVMEKLAQAAEKTVPSVSSHKHKEPER